MMMMPRNLIPCLYIATVWGVSLVACFIKYSNYRRFSEKIAVANMTSEWVSDLSCVVNTLIPKLETTRKTSEFIQCFTTRGEHSELSLWAIVGRRKVTYRAQNTRPRQKNSLPQEIRKPTKPTVTESHDRNSSFILVLDVGNRVVYKLKTGPNQRHAKYVYPEADVLRDIEYSTKDRKILWVCRWSIVSTPLKPNLTKKDVSSYRWRENASLRKVRRGSRETFILTSRHIYKLPFHYSSTSRKEAIATNSHPYHVQLDEQQRYIYWVEQPTHLAHLMRISYNGGRKRTIHSAETMDSFTVTVGAYYLLYCGPNPRIALMHNLKQDKEIAAVKDDCLGIAYGNLEKHILTSSSLVTVTNKGQSFSHSFSIREGDVKYIK